MLHALEADDVPVTLDASQLFCDATNGKLSIVKSHSHTLGAHPSLPLSAAGIHAASGLKYLSAHPPLSPLAAAAISRNLQRVCNLCGALRRSSGEVQLQQLLALLPDWWRSVATAADIPLHGPFCNVAQEQRPLPLDHPAVWCATFCLMAESGMIAVAHSAISAAAHVWVPLCRSRASRLHVPGGA